MLLLPLLLLMAMLGLTLFPSLQLKSSRFCIQRIHLHQHFILIIGILRLMPRKYAQMAPGAPRQWWFGGGTDLTPADIFEEDVKHFHSVQKRACDKIDPSFYPRFKRWCDDYFYIKVYDWETTFGLKTGGRIEFFLVSLLLTARWEYDHAPEEGSEEWKLLDAFVNPNEWI
ncbi:oxygen-dependent coproporphyrinogen-III oxidase, chloroplastic-like isoform X2 [Apium graveolens]|uniref:oxygen-dependent coproporphyrinogen-III oxidase, chloroplastic-like isoform X2 n=1 Tax=Apium graveolens TaxID=4045 RepID=UPI003D797672